MDEIIQRFNQSAIRYLLIGGQAVRLEGLPRFSMDWDLYIPPRDLDNIRRINELLAGDLDVELEPLGPKGENFVQTYQMSCNQRHLAQDYQVRSSRSPGIQRGRTRGADANTR